MRKYEKIIKDYKKLINEKKLKPDDRLPTRKALSKKYNVSLSTVNKALSELERINLIYHRQGSGSFVTKSMTNKVVMFSENNQLKCTDNQLIQLLDIYESTDNVINKKLRLTDTEVVHVIERTKNINGYPYSLQRNYIPNRFFEQFDFVTTDTGISVAENFDKHFGINTYDTDFKEKIEIRDDIAIKDLKKIGLSLGTPVVCFNKNSYFNNSIYEVIHTILDYNYYEINITSK